MCCVVEDAVVVEDVVVVEDACGDVVAVVDGDAAAVV